MVRVSALVCGVAAIALAAAAQTPSPADRIEAQVLDAANDFRSDHQLAPLQTNPILSSEARAFAEYLVRTGKFSHTADGRDPGDRARAAGYDYCEMAENIAYEEDDAGYRPDRVAQVFMSGWEKSPGHRRNLLNAEVSETGIGVARIDRGSLQKYVAVQEFGRPASTRREFRIENRSEADVAYEFDGANRRVPAHSTMSVTTCAEGQILFRPPGGEPSRYAAEPGARYVLTDASGRVQVEMDRRQPSGARPD